MDSKKPGPAEKYQLAVLEFLSNSVAISEDGIIAALEDGLSEAEDKNLHKIIAGKDIAATFLRRHAARLLAKNAEKRRKALGSAVYELEDMQQVTVRHLRSDAGRPIYLFHASPSGLTRLREWRALSDNSNVEAEQQPTRSGLSHLKLLFASPSTR